MASPPDVTVYQERQAALVEATRSLLGDKLVVDAKPAGLHAMAWLADSLQATELSRQLAALNIEAPPLSNYTIHSPTQQGLVLGYGAFTPHQIWETVRKMADVFLQI